MDWGGKNEAKSHHCSHHCSRLPLLVQWMTLSLSQAQTTIKFQKFIVGSEVPLPITTHHHHHQSLDCEGRWGTTDDFATTHPAKFSCDDQGGSHATGILVNAEENGETYRPTSMQKSPRMVPGLEARGFVAPSIARPILTTSLPSHTCSRTSVG